MRTKFFIICFSFVMLFTGITYAADNVVSGPFSLTVSGGAMNDSAFASIEGRVDYLTPAVNLHLMGVYAQSDAGNGMGRIDPQRYGLGAAVSHTYANKLNLFVGTSFTNIMNENFFQAYMGAKYKISDSLFLSGSGGVAFGPERTIKTDSDGAGVRIEAENWIKVGAVHVAANNLKTNLYTYWHSPMQKNIFGIEGEVSYPITEAMTVGVRGGSDLEGKSQIKRDWQAAAFITYAFGSQKGKLIDVALNKNNPLVFPRITTKEDDCIDGGGNPEIPKSPRSRIQFIGSKCQGGLPVD